MVGRKRSSNVNRIAMSLGVLPTGLGLLFVLSCSSGGRNASTPTSTPQSTSISATDPTPTAIRGAQATPTGILSYPPPPTPSPPPSLHPITTSTGVPEVDRVLEAVTN